MFDIVKKAKVKSVDLAKLLNVSRVTVSLWLRGRRVPHHLLKARVDLLLEAIRMAEEAGTLPVSADTKQDERFTKVRQAIEDELHDMGRTIYDVSGSDI